MKIRPRAIDLDFESPIPRHWFCGSPLATHMNNGVNLLFPAGERFFIRSVRHFLSTIEDQALRAQVIGFFGQEGRHAGAHERFFRALETQGYEIESFLTRYERIAFGKLEPRFSPEVRLSVTAALEHFTAIMAESALKERFLDEAHPELRKLIYWHAAEEIEHKAVAFDVLTRVNPSYPLRMAGLLIATLGLGSCWFLATLHFLQQEDDACRAKARAEALELLGDKGPARNVFLRGIRLYARRDFHPSHMDNGALAAEYLASIGATGAEPTTGGAAA